MIAILRQSRALLLLLVGVSLMAAGMAWMAILLVGRVL